MLPKWIPFLIQGSSVWSSLVIMWLLMQTLAIFDSVFFVARLCWLVHPSQPASAYVFIVLLLTVLWIFLKLVLVGRWWLFPVLKILLITISSMWMSGFLQVFRCLLSSCCRLLVYGCNWAMATWVEIKPTSLNPTVKETCITPQNHLNGSTNPRVCSKPPRHNNQRLLNDEKICYLESACSE